MIQSFPVILIMGVMLLIFNDMGIFKWYQLKQERNKIQAEIDQLIAYPVKMQTTKSQSALSISNLSDSKI